MKNIVFIGNCDDVIFLSVVETLFLVASRNWASIVILNLPLNACVNKQNCFNQEKILQVIITLPSDLVVINVLSVTLKFGRKCC